MRYLVKGEVFVLNPLATGFTLFLFKLTLVITLSLTIVLN